MAALKPQPVFGDLSASPSPSAPWQQTHGMYLAGRSFLDGADAVAIGMEAKWGADRLRLLVGPELREKFDRQRYLLNQAIWHGDLEAIRREAPRMITAWQVLDRAAVAAGATELDPEVWEIALEDGSVAALVPSPQHISAAAKTVEGRLVKVYTLDEIARLLSGFPGIAQAKVIWPGATVTAVRKSVGDPLDGIADTRADLDDEIPL